MSSKKNKQRIDSKKVKEQPPSKSITIAAVVGIFIILVLVYFLIPGGSQEWKVDKDGVLSYPENRGKIDVKVLETESRSNYTLENISFTSKDYTVEGLLRIPSSGKKVPAIVILPELPYQKKGRRDWLISFQIWDMQAWASSSETAAGWILDTILNYLKPEKNRSNIKWYLMPCARLMH